eukprot:TRINITY_DN38725_c0_g1_i1.p1 TRINITY_DN38725_c0_g1~~TRINITY_DN38725_c0_g1_i1.p1  ORF type:complete len:720 (+),score=111.46 TRINITY_DN38725_c0_g1_i1:129-2288(+)
MAKPSFIETDAENTFQRVDSTGSPDEVGSRWTAIRQNVRERKFLHEIHELNEALESEREEHRREKENLEAKLQEALEVQVQGALALEREKHQADVDDLHKLLNQERSVATRDASVRETQLKHKIEKLHEALESEREHNRRQNKELREELVKSRRDSASQMQVREMELQHEIQELDEVLELEREQHQQDQEALQGKFDEALELEREKHRVFCQELEESQPVIAQASLKDTEIQRLRVEVSKLRQELSSKQIEHAAKCAQLQAQHKQQVVKADSLEQECERWRSRNTELEQECAMLREQIAEASKADVSSIQDMTPRLQQPVANNADSKVPANELKIGSRVCLGKHVGNVQYIGDAQFAPGEWIGIALDEPTGKNDGSVAGVQYFHCLPKHGLFARRAKLSGVPVATGEAVEQPLVMTTVPRSSSIQLKPKERRSSHLSTSTRTTCMKSRAAESSLGTLSPSASMSSLLDAKKTDEKHNSSESGRHIERSSMVEAQSDVVLKTSEGEEIKKEESERSCQVSTHAASMTEKDFVPGKFKTDSDRLKHQHHADKTRKLEDECEKLQMRLREAAEEVAKADREWAKLVVEVESSTKTHVEKVAQFSSELGSMGSNAFRLATVSFHEDVVASWHVHAEKFVEIQRRYATLRKVLNSSKEESESEELRDEIEATKVAMKKLRQETKLEIEDLQKDVDRLCLELRVEREKSSQSTSSWLLCGVSSYF